MITVIFVFLGNQNATKNLLFGLEFKEEHIPKANFPQIEPLDLKL